ncbi:MAG: ATP phosphoribosyltransferase regulatory subunit [Tissierellia bacterium]|nr:ATP phosphoribosyltransferase regulatory subunit [Tissierellia bacterium]
MEFRTLREKLEFSHEKYKVMTEMEELFVYHGYLYLEPDPFDDYQKYIRSGGEDEGQYLKVILPGGDVNLLKADPTIGLVEDIYMEGITSPLKVFYNEDVFRNYYGNTDIITKVGVEVFGQETLETDIEIFTMATTILEKYHKEPMIEIGLGPVVHLFLERGQFTEEEKKKILNYIRHKDSCHLKDYIKEIDKWKEGEIFCKLLQWHGSWEEIQEYIEILRKDTSIAPILEHMEGLHAFFKEKAKVRIRYDFAIVPDFNYYSSFSFRGFFPDCNEELIKGGRYQLINREGKVVPGVGFSVELTTLMNYLGGKQ